MALDASDISNDILSELTSHGFVVEDGGVSQAKILIDAIAAAIVARITGDAEVTPTPTTVPTTCGGTVNLQAITWTIS